jgi:hypothetical protein
MCDLRDQPHFERAFLQALNFDDMTVLPKPVELVRTPPHHPHAAPARIRRHGYRRHGFHSGHECQFDLVASETAQRCVSLSQLPRSHKDQRMGGAVYVVLRIRRHEAARDPPGSSSTTRVHSHSLREFGPHGMASAAPRLIPLKASISSLAFWPRRKQGGCAIHPKAMPVILTRADEIERWLTADANEALALQRPLPDGSLKVVASGAKEDIAPD